MKEQVIEQSRTEAELLHQIMSLAIENHALLEITVKYSSNYHEFEIQVVEKGASSQLEHKNGPRLLHEHIYLGNRFEGLGDSFEKLLSVEDKLIDLISEAKDKQVAAA
ncbi:hypothetical protein AB6C88_17250 [Vibrio splendidus]